MREAFLLLIAVIVVVFYGIIPIVGIMITRYKWMQFRKRFNFLRHCKLLDYRQYRKLENNGEVFRFTGGIESITDGRILWVKGEDMTIPVSLEKIKCFLLPIEENDETEAPLQIHWNQVSALPEGAKVFIGGLVKIQKNSLNFCTTKEEPLMIIFYNCPDDDLPVSLISRARSRNDYWNNLTPISLVTGALALIFIASSFLGRPAFHLIVIIAIIAVFIPILPAVPPGFLFTILGRRIAWNVRKQKAKLELMRFGLLPGNKPGNTPSAAENYGRPNPRYAIKTYIAEFFSWLILLSGVLLNMIFILIILFQFEIISF